MATVNPMDPGGDDRGPQQTPVFSCGNDFPYDVLCSNKKCTKRNRKLRHRQHLAKGKQGWVFQCANCKTWSYVPSNVLASARLAYPGHFE